MTKPVTRLHYIDVLNCIAIFFVLMLHSSQLANFGNDGYSHMQLAKLLQVLCIPAVFIFFMNSGATLLNYRKRQTTKQFFERRGQRVLVPFIFWSVIYYLFDTKYRAFPGPIPHPEGASLHGFIAAFLNNNINNLFWFFYAIIALYLVAPILSVLADKHKDTLCYVVVIYFVVNDILAYLGHLIGKNIVTEFVSQPLLSSSFVGFFIMGYLIKENYFSIKIQNFLIIAGCITLVASIINVLTDGKYIFLSGYSSFLYSVALYLVVKRVTTKIKQEGVLKFFALMSGASLGIYILHPIFFAIFDKVVFHETINNWQNYLVVMNSWVHIFILPVVSYALLVVLVLCLKKIKLIAKVLP
ncbi:acyltransferase [Ligilactobacillus murinus]|nr:acyltransferase [Ligilactobacillus murinus]